MAAERNRVYAGERVSRASVDAARGATLADIDAAIAACDYERAATLAIARARGGESVPTDTIGRILPGIEFPAITCALVALAAERAQLLDIVERRRFPISKDAYELEAIVLYGAWRAGADVVRVIPQLRRLSARTMTAEGYALLATIAAAIDDPNVRAAAKPIASFAKEYAKQVATDDKAMTASIDAVYAALPAEVAVSRGGFTVRADKQVGRNDPCPCGSGNKFKKCCADKPAVTPSPVPGVAWEDFLGSAANRITIEHIDELALADLVKVDVTLLEHPVLAAVLRRFIAAHEWSHAERMIAELVRRDPKQGAEFRDELALSLLDVGDLERARTHIRELPPELAKHFNLELAIAEGPAAAWNALVTSARAAVGSTDKISDLDFAYSLLRAEPALGIVAARACVGTAHLDDGDLMLELVEEARDRLNLPPTDAAWDVLDAITAPDKKQKAEDDAQLRASLNESSARIDQLERTLAQVRAELADARTLPAAELMRRPEDQGKLDAKVRELEALIREGNAERRELRKQLDAATPTVPVAHADEAGRREGPRARRLTVAETDDDPGDDVELGTRNYAIPRFDRRATDALADVPATVAAEAMRTIGTLAAGDGFAWRGVKQAKDMVRPVLMARVGIHHRLIFRVEDGMLDVLDLITREQLLTTLKRLRGQR